MFTKLFSLLVIVTAWYGATAFIAPETANRIDSVIWMPWLSQKITWFKSNFDDIVTDIPSVEEFKSGALDIKETVIDWVNTTKETIDDVRWWAQKIENTYNDAREVVDDLSWKVENIKTALDDVQWLWDSISNVINTDLVESIDTKK